MQLIIELPLYVMNQLFQLGQVTEYSHLSEDDLIQLLIQSEVDRRKSASNLPGDHCSL